MGGGGRRRRDGRGAAAYPSLGELLGKVDGPYARPAAGVEHALQRPGLASRTQVQPALEGQREEVVLEIQSFILGLGAAPSLAVRPPGVVSSAGSHSVVGQDVS